jgi:L-arabinose isomerase
MTKLKIGLLPFYLELYDKILPPEGRNPLETFYALVSESFQHKGVLVVKAPVCRLKTEFAAAVRGFEKAEVDAIVTLHLAYSPSLESAEILARTRLPVIVLDTTPDYSFDRAGKIMFNHGIHGVQDMCNLLIRNGKPFVIEAGHWKNSDVLDRVTSKVCSARLASAFRNSRVGRIGESFAGMGDFSVPLEVMNKKLGIQVLACDGRYLSRICKSIPPRDIEAEIKNNKQQFTIRPGIEKAHQRSAQAGLAVRRWVEQGKLTAFTVNFMEVTRATGLPTMPFLEAGLAMARGIGYAGEGDILTAALVGALASVFPGTTFTEMFCPDWKRNTIFLSHMGEVNVNLLAGKPVLLEYPFIFGDVENPVKPVGCLRGGKAVFVNLAPLAGDQFRLILAPVTMKAVKGKDWFSDSVRGWMKPSRRISDFLEAYSRAGGTHHAALVYGADINTLTGFGTIMGWQTVVID